MKDAIKDTSTFICAQCRLPAPKCKGALLFTKAPPASGSYPDNSNSAPIRNCLLGKGPFPEDTTWTTCVTALL